MSIGDWLSKNIEIDKETKANLERLVKTLSSLGSLHFSFLISFGVFVYGLFQCSLHIVLPFIVFQFSLYVISLFIVLATFILISFPGFITLTIIYRLLNKSVKKLNNSISEFFNHLVTFADCAIFVSGIAIFFQVFIFDVPAPNWFTQIGLGLDFEFLNYCTHTPR